MLRISPRKFHISAFFNEPRPRTAGCPNASLPFRLFRVFRGCPFFNSARREKHGRHEMTRREPASAACGAGSNWDPVGDSPWLPAFRSPFQLGEHPASGGRGPRATARNSVCGRTVIGPGEAGILTAGGTDVRTRVVQARDGRRSCEIEIVYKYSLMRWLCPQRAFCPQTRSAAHKVWEGVPMTIDAKELALGILRRFEPSLEWEQIENEISPNAFDEYVPHRTDGWKRCVPASLGRHWSSLPEQVRLGAYLLAHEINALGD